MQLRLVSCRRLQNYSACGISMTVLGLVLLELMVDVMQVNVYLTQGVLVPAVTGTITFALHKLGIFADREVKRGKCLRRWISIKVGGYGVSKGFFLLLVALAGVPFLLASLLITSVLAGPSYLLIRDWAFAPETKKP